MNRSLTSVILGGFGNKPVNSIKQEAISGTHLETNVDQVADLMINSKNIIITPGKMKKMFYHCFLYLARAINIF